MEKQCKQCSNIFIKKDKVRGAIYCEPCRKQRTKDSVNKAMKKYLNKKKMVQQ